MTPQFTFKLGMLLGTLDDYLVRVEDGTFTQGDTDRVRCFVKDVKKQFFAMQTTLESKEELKS